MFDNINKDEKSLIKAIEHERMLLNHHYVGTEHLLLALLKLPKSRKICEEVGLTYSLFKKQLIKVVGIGSTVIKKNVYTPLLHVLINNSINSNGGLNEVSLLYDIAKLKEGIAYAILNELHINMDKLDRIIYPGDLIILNETVNNDEITYLRDEEIKRIENILIQKNKCNPLIIGASGVGKTAIVEELTRRINSNLIVSKLKNKKIVLLDISRLVAGTKYRGEFEEKLNKIIDFVKEKKDIILFIDEIHTIINAGGAEGAIGCADILKPYLARGIIKCIGATTKEEYRLIEKDQALLRRFQVVYVNEPTITETEKILLKVKKNYEQFYNNKISNSLINYLVNASSRYILNIANPDKSLTILDATMARAINEGKTISKSLINETISNYLNVKSLHNRKIEINNLISTDRDKINDYINNEAAKIVIDLSTIDLNLLKENNIINPLIRIKDEPDSKIFIRNYLKSSLILKKFIKKIIINKELLLNDGTKLFFAFATFVFINLEEENIIGFIKGSRKNSEFANIVNIKLDTIALKS